VCSVIKKPASCIGRIAHHGIMQRRFVILLHNYNRSQVREKIVSWQESMKR
jgi:hypothetical protein